MSKNWRGLISLMASLILMSPCHGQAPGATSGSESLPGATQKWIIQATTAAKDKWKEPTHSTPMSAVVRMDIAPDGRISNIRVQQSSSDNAFDFSAVNA